MGGRGGHSGFNWKSQLQSMAKQGRMPHAIMADRGGQSAVMKEIDRLYPMLQTDAHVIDQGDGVWVQVNGVVARASYPSGKAASGAEKRGTLKMLLYNCLK